MPQPISSTLDRIHAAARDEFLVKGYQAASLRNIVKTAGVTTGAFYGYYDSKEALFAALVDEPYRHVLETYRTAVFGFEALRPEEQVTQMGQVGKTCMQELLGACEDYLAAFDSFEDSRRSADALVAAIERLTPQLTRSAARFGAEVLRYKDQLA